MCTVRFRKFKRFNSSKTEQQAFSFIDRLDIRVSKCDFSFHIEFLFRSVNLVFNHFCHSVDGTVFGYLWRILCLRMALNVEIALFSSARILGSRLVQGMILMTFCVKLNKMSKSGV